MTKTLLLILTLSVITLGSNAQVKDSLHYKTIAASPSLNNKSAKWQKNWGTNRRAEWTTPVTVPIARLDTLYGGLKVVEVGGGNETRSVQLRSASGKQYAMRSINKSRDDVIEDRFRGSIIEDIILDGVSSSYPYGAFVIPYMQEKAGLLHAKPVLFYVPQQPVLDTLNARFGNDLYLIEQRPDDDWSEAPNFGYHKDFSSTEKMMKKMMEDNDHLPDQFAFIKARLFDMLVGDWDRHGGNWRWAKKDSGDINWYTPIARDRDQAFYTHNGKLLDKFLPMAGFAYMQNFDTAVTNITTLNKPERSFDHFFSNAMDGNDWQRAAKELQSALTDEVIRRSVQGLPPEIYAISGEELISKLIARRAQLPRFADEYYKFIATEIEIVGSEEKEYFDVQRSDASTTVSIYRNKKKGREATPYYNRVFLTGETNEIRLFGIDDEDIYNIQGNSPITLRIIGGPDKDSVIQMGSRVHIYDNRDNKFQASSARTHLRSDSAVHQYKFDWHPDNARGFGAIMSDGHSEQPYAGLGYSCKNYKWRREPFASSHQIGVAYMFMQRAVSALWSAVFPKRIGKWDILTDLRYDFLSWRNFYGLGNETVKGNKERSYHIMRSREWHGALGLQRDLGKTNLRFIAFYDNFDMLNDTARFVKKEFTLSDPVKAMEPNSYAGLRFTFSHVNVNDAVLPTKGIGFMLKAQAARDMELEEFYQVYSGKLQLYIPLGRKFSIASRAGGTTVSGDQRIINSASPYQHAMIGGPESFRGFRMERFWGKTSFYNNNDLRFITQLRSHLLNADFGILGFFDNGRVWMPNENSELWHTTWGGGILLAPFHAVSLQVTYGISPEAKMIQFRINTPL